jgi:hypothetical protein
VVGPEMRESRFLRIVALTFVHMQHLRHGDIRVSSPMVVSHLRVVTRSSTLKIRLKKEGIFVASRRCGRGDYSYLNNLPSLQTVYDFRKTCRKVLQYGATSP